LGTQDWVENGVIAERRTQFKIGYHGRGFRLRKTPTLLLLLLCSLGLLALATYTYGAQWFNARTDKPKTKVAVSAPAAKAPNPSVRPGGTSSEPGTNSAQPSQGGTPDSAEPPHNPEPAKPPVDKPNPDLRPNSGARSGTSRGDSVKPARPKTDEPSSEVNYRNFVPVPMESPGGGRIKDFKRPDPEDLVLVKGTNYKLHRLVAKAYLAMVADARASGINYPLLQLYDGYRTREQQAAKFREAVKKYGSEDEARLWVAKYSNHETGRAIDLYLGGSNDKTHSVNGSLRELRAYKWLEKNARRYGFYPYDDPWPGEPWHWEYNPPVE